MENRAKIGIRAVSINPRAALSTIPDAAKFYLAAKTLDFGSIA